MKKVLESECNRKERFIKDWIRGKVKSSELYGQMKKLNIRYSQNMGIVVIKVLENRDFNIGEKWSIDLLCYGIKNIAREITDDFNNLNVLIDSKKQIVIISDTTPVREWQKLNNVLEDSISKYLDVKVVTESAFLRDDPVQANIVYKTLCNKLIEKSKKAPLIIEVQKYINKNYFKEELSINEIANEMSVSQNYIIRLMKRELGMSFMAYLTNVRIKNSIVLMRDKSLELYEIAELVGYGTQHYFSNIFKKNVGISPIDYKVGLNNKNK